MSAKRCPACRTAWPPTIDYERCPECDVKTTGEYATSPILRSEAKRRVRVADFNHRYADRELDRIHRGEPSPDDVGAGEAHQIMREIGKLEQAYAEAELPGRVMDEQFVREWVELAARGVGMGGIADDGNGTHGAVSDFADRVLARLRKGARTYGEDNYLTVPLEQLEREAAEEGDDLAGWLVAATARIFFEIRHHRIDGAVAQVKQERYLRAAGLGLLAWHELEAARDAS